MGKLMLMSSGSGCKLLFDSKDQVMETGGLPHSLIFMLKFISQKIFSVNISEFKAVN